MSTAPRPPASLSESRIKAPHKGARTRDFPNISYLELSFANGNLAEMEYWIASGVVEQAMAGKSRSKRIYSQSLMDVLSLKLGRPPEPLGAQAQARMDAVLETLWTLGAHQHTDRHAQWFGLLPGFALADRFLDLGLATGTRNTQTTRIQVNSEHRSAMENLLSILVEHQKARHWTSKAEAKDPPNVTTWVTRMNRFLEQEGQDPVVLNQALGLVFAGDLTKGTRRAIPWTTWRDRLIDLGANAHMVHQDALNRLCYAAPNTPVRGHYLWTRAQQWQKQQDEEGPTKKKVPSELMTQWAQEEIDRRALRWIRLSNDWINALDAPLKRPLGQQELEWLEDSWRYQQVSQDTDLWTTMLDAPGGTELATAVARRLGGRGQLLPWSAKNSETKPRLSHEDTSRELTTINKKISARRLDQLATILAAPGVAAYVDDAWRVKVAEETLRYDSLGERANDPPPGMTYDPDTSPRWVTPALRYDQKAKVPPLEDLRGLLKLAGPRTFLGKSNQSNRWIWSVLNKLPHYWAAQNIDDAHRAQYLVMLDQHDGLADVRRVGRNLMACDGIPRDERAEIVARDTGEINGDWYSSWIQNADAQHLLARVLDEQAERLPEDEFSAGAGVRRMALWGWVSGSYLEAREMMERTQPPEWAMEVLIHDRGAMDLLETCTFDRLAKLGVLSSEEKLEKVIFALRNLMTLGWQPQDASKAMGHIGDCFGKSRAAPKDDVQDVVLDIIHHLGMEPTAAGERLVEALVQKGETNNSNKAQWSYLCAKVIEAGGKPDLPGDFRSLGPLGNAVGIILDRQKLTTMAHETIQESEAERSRARRM